MTNRHADPVTIDHVIELRREIRRLEKLVEDYRRRAENAADKALSLYLENNHLKASITRNDTQEYHGTNTTD